MRPKKENPRNTTVAFKVTAAEKQALEIRVRRSSTADSVSEYIHQELFGEPEKRSWWKKIF